MFVLFTQFVEIFLSIIASRHIFEEIIAQINSYLSFQCLNWLFWSYWKHELELCISFLGTFKTIDRILFDFFFGRHRFSSGRLKIDTFSGHSYQKIKFIRNIQILMYEIKHSKEKMNHFIESVGMKIQNSQISNSKLQI